MAKELEMQEQARLKREQELLDEKIRMDMTDFIRVNFVCFQG